VRVEDLDTGRSRAEHEARQLCDLRSIGLDWDGPVVRQSERLERYAEAIARLDGGGLLYRCYCTRAEIRAAASAPHGELPEGAYPGTCRELTVAQRAEREGAGRPRPCGWMPAARRSGSPTACSAPAAAWSTTSSCDAATARPPTTSPLW
jgi:glutamyl/glutaminyl-tRNA synthetase